MHLIIGNGGRFRVKWLLVENNSWIDLFDIACWDRSLSYWVMMAYVSNAL